MGESAHFPFGEMPGTGAPSSSLVRMTTTLLVRRAAPAPPERARTLFATLVFLVLLGGDVLRNATGFWGWGVVCVWSDMIWVSKL